MLQLFKFCPQQGSDGARRLPPTKALCLEMSEKYFSGFFLFFQPGEL